MQDVVVIGGGPAGAHFARQAVKRGYTVSIVEQKPLGRYKCCGGGISARFLEAYSIPEKVIERGITSFLMISPTGEKTELDFGRRVGVTVYRSIFDKWLLEDAQDAGSDFILGEKPKQLHFEKDYVELKLSNEQVIRAKLLIGAFGLDPEMYQMLGIQMPDFMMGSQIELAMLEEQIDRSIGNRLEFYFDPTYTDHGYVWVFPKREGVSVGMVTTPSERLKREKVFSFVRNHPIASKELENSSPRLFDGRDFHSAMIPNSLLETTYGNNYVLLGDSAGFMSILQRGKVFFLLSSQQTWQLKP